MELLKSSSGSWTNNSTDVTPQIEQGRPSNLTPTGTQEPRTLGVLIKGTFQSYFQDAERAEKLTDVAHASISQSPESARLIVLSAPAMFTDQVIALMNSLGAGDPLTNLSLMVNTIDWVTQDESLLSIRSRSHFKRTLFPPPETTKSLLLEPHPTATKVSKLKRARDSIRPIRSEKFLKILPPIFDLALPCK